MYRVSEMNTTTLIFSAVNGLFYYDMLEFNDLKCEAFKKQSVSMQLLYMFQDALRMLNQQYCDKKRVVSQTCEVSSERFTIRVRIYELPDVSFPIYWFVCQSSAYRAVRANSRSRIDVVPNIGHPSFVEVVYSVWFDEPIPF